MFYIPFIFRNTLLLLHTPCQRHTKRIQCHLSLLDQFCLVCNLTYNFLQNCVHIDLAFPPEKEKQKPFCIISLDF